MRTRLHQQGLSSNERVVLLHKLSNLHLLLGAAIKQLSQREKDCDLVVFDQLLVSGSDVFDILLNRQDS